MGIYQYRALGESGKKTKGFIDADTLDDAKLRLSQKKILVTKISALSKKTKQLRLSKEEVLSFTRELCRLLEAGIPLFDSLYTLKEKGQNKKLQTVIYDLCDQIKNGTSLSNALMHHRLSFDPLYIAMIKKAERSADLSTTLRELIIYLERTRRLKKQLTSALIYPSILLCFCFFVLGSLFFFVIPALSELFVGRSLSPLTTIVLKISNWVTQHSAHLSMIGCLFLSLILSCVLSKRLKQILHQVLLKLPICKKFFQEVSLMRFCRTFSSLLLAGVTFLQALRLAAQTLNHPPLEKAFHDAEKQIIEGKYLSDALKNNPNVPFLFLRMLYVAEQSSSMAKTLEHTATIYEEDLEKKLAQITTILQPVLLLFLGLIVGVVLLSVLLPLTDVGSFME